MARLFTAVNENQTKEFSHGSIEIHSLRNANTLMMCQFESTYHVIAAASNFINGWHLLQNFFSILYYFSCTVCTSSLIVHGASDHVWAGSVSWADVGTLEGLLLPRLLGPAAGH